MVISEKEKRKKQKLEYLQSVGGIGKQSSTPKRSLSLSDIQTAANTGNDLEESVVEIVHNIIGENFSKEVYILLKLPKYVQSLYATWLLEADVMNGGLTQFFFNHPIEIWQIALNGYSDFGLNDSLLALQKALVKAQGNSSTFNEFNEEDKSLDRDWQHAKYVKNEHVRNHPHLYVIAE